MKHLLVFSLLTIVSCTTSTNANFQLVSVGGNYNCKILFDSGKPVVRTGAKGPFVLGGGDNCPDTYAGVGGIRISKKKSIEVGSDKHYATFVNWPWKGSVEYSLIRRHPSGASAPGIYKIKTTKKPVKD